MLSVDHGAPVTQVLLLPGGGTLLSAGGNYVRLWDLVGGGRLLHQFSHHQKLITCMTLDGTRTRLITAGLDSLIKIHELATFTVVASLRADAPIMSLAVSPDNARLVVGGTDASLTIRHRVAKVAEIAAERAAARLLRGGTYRYFMRGQSTVAAAGDVVAGGPPGAELTASGKVKRRKKLAAHDAMLKRFEYGAALDAALLSNDPVLVTSVLEELAARDGLHKSLGGRDEERLAPLLGFLTRHVNDPKHASVLLDVGELVVTMYASTMGTSTTLDALFARLRDALARELALGRELIALQGALDSLLAAATTGSGGADAAAAAGGSLW